MRYRHFGKDLSDPTIGEVAGSHPEYGKMGKAI